MWLFVGSVEVGLWFLGVWQLVTYNKRGDSPDQALFDGFIRQMKFGYSQIQMLLMTLMVMVGVFWGGYLIKDYLRSISGSVLITLTGALWLIPNAIFDMYLSNDNLALDSYVIMLYRGIGLGFWLLLWIQYRKAEIGLKDTSKVTLLVGLINYMTFSIYTSGNLKILNPNFIHMFLACIPYVYPFIASVAIIMIAIIGREYLICSIEKEAYPHNRQEESISYLKVTWCILTVLIGVVLVCYCISQKHTGTTKLSSWINVIKTESVLMILLSLVQWGIIEIL